MNRMHFVKVGLLGALGMAIPKSASATGTTCRVEGHPCEGNQECCTGLTCLPGTRGSARRCGKPSPPGGPCDSNPDCQPGCECDNGTCQPPVDPGDCSYCESTEDCVGGDVCFDGYCQGCSNRRQMRFDRDRRNQPICCTKTREGKVRCVKANRVCREDFGGVGPDGD